MTKKVNLKDGLQKFVALNPMLVRGVLVSVAALLANIVGRTVIDNDLIDSLIGVLTAVSAFIAYLLTKDKVIAENKVIAYKLDPTVTDEASNIVAGPVAVDTPTEIAATKYAATGSASQKENKANVC